MFMQAHIKDPCKEEHERVLLVLCFGSDIKWTGSLGPLPVHRQALFVPDTMFVRQFSGKGHRCYMIPFWMDICLGVQLHRNGTLCFYRWLKKLICTFSCNPGSKIKKPFNLGFSKVWVVLKLFSCDGLPCCFLKYAQKWMYLLCYILVFLVLLFCLPKIVFSSEDISAFLADASSICSWKQPTNGHDSHSDDNFSYALLWRQNDARWDDCPFLLLITSAFCIHLSVQFHCKSNKCNNA